MNNKSNKIADIVLFLAFLVLESVIVTAGFWNKELNSDVSNHILQAQDILAGNLLYHDWNLSKISFLTGDMFFYEFTVLVKGISYPASVLANALMALAVQLALYFTCLYGKKYSVFEKLCIMALIAVPSIGLLRRLMMHTGCWIYCMIGYMIYSSLQSISKDDKRYKKYSIILVAVWAWSIFGDFLILLYGAGPCFLYSFIKAYREKELRVRIEHLKLAALNIYGPIIGYVITFLYFSIGGANRGGHVMGLQFLPYSQWRSMWDSMVVTLMDMFGADFTGRKAFMPDTILRYFSFLILLAGVFFFAYSLVQFIRNKYDDTFSVILDIAIIIAAMTYIFTTRSADRYITNIALFFCILIVRNIHIIWDKSAHNLEINRIIAGFIVVCSMMGHCLGIVEKARTPIQDSHYELVDFLEEHGLTNGYSSYWNASISTVLSDQKVCIRHIEKNMEGGYSPVCLVWEEYVV